MGSFGELGLNGSLARSCESLAMAKPTEIQSMVIPFVLKGSNVIGHAQTGSGKTAAFALPIIHQLGQDPFGVFALVLTPTRELAVQIQEQFLALGAHLRITCACIIGGGAINAQKQEIDSRPHIVVATPGRLAHLIKQGVNLRVDYLRFLVFDEADRLFGATANTTIHQGSQGEKKFVNHYSDGFAKDIKTIIKCLPPVDERQSLFFSATITKALLKKVRSVTKGAKSQCRYFRVEGDVLNVESLDQRVCRLQHKSVKDGYLTYILTSEAFERQQCIVFVASCAGCQLVNETLLESGIDSVCLHSDMIQRRRIAALQKFRASKARVLVATDVASRGLDIPKVRLCVNYDLPRIVEDYAHRIGRTARAGRKGMAISFVTPPERSLFESLEKYVNKSIEDYEVDDKEVLPHVKKSGHAKAVARVRLVEYDEQAAMHDESQKLRLMRKKRDKARKEAHIREVVREVGDKRSRSDREQRKTQKRHKKK